MKAPTSWKIMDSKYIATLNKLQNDDIKMIGAFMAPHNEIDVPVSFYDYGKLGEEFISVYNEGLNKLNEMNKFIDRESTVPDHESAITDEVLFNSDISNAYGEFFVVVLKHYINDTTSIYTVQIFQKREVGLFVGQTTLTMFNESNAEMELCENKLILDIYRTLSLI